MTGKEVGLGCGSFEMFCAPNAKIMTEISEKSFTLRKIRFVGECSRPSAPEWYHERRDVTIVSQDPSPEPHCISFFHSRLLKKVNSPQLVPNFLVLSLFWRLRVRPIRHEGGQGAWGKKDAGMDFSRKVKHWDKCKLRTALEWVVFTSSKTTRLDLNKVFDASKNWKWFQFGLEGNRRIDLWS